MDQYRILAVCCKYDLIRNITFFEFDVEFPEIFESKYAKSNPSDTV
jgi:hypothetical protein